MIPLEKINEKIEKMIAPIRNNISLVKKIAFITFGILIVLSLILGIYNRSVLSGKISKLEKELDTLSSDIDQFKNDNENLTAELQNFNELKVKILTDLAINKLRLDQYSKAVFNAADSSKGFARLDSSTGMFFLILDKTEQFSDGYKLYFRLGNPQNCVYNGCKVKIRWGQKYDRENEDVSYEDWEKSLKSSELSIKDMLIPGQWCSFDVAISPAKSEDVQYVELKIQAEQISMQKSKD
ncbi:MAG TPA: DUF3251 domain-containing protein [Clostridiales bacterium]|nr:DUF3251 domain-containing protein [Clostridiales bacterium]